MFNFQKEVVLNNPKEQVRIANLASESADPEVKVVRGIDPKMVVHDGGEYFGKYIVEGKVYRTIPIHGVNAKITFKPGELETVAAPSQHIQILIELGLDNDYRGDFGSALWYFRKPILVDLDATMLSTDDLVKAFNKAIPQEYKFLTVKKEGDNVVLEGADSYIKVRDVKVIGFVCDTRCEGNSEEPTILAEMKKNDKSITIGTCGEVTKNNVEFGTYNYLIQNLRLPTYANLRFTSPSAVEMPMQGVDYVQYSFAYCVPRSISFGGLSVAGQTNHSTTLHTFFVPDTKDGMSGKGNKVFEDYLGKILKESFIVDIGREGEHVIEFLPDSYPSSADLKAVEENTVSLASVKASTTKSKAAAKVDNSNIA